MLGIFRYKRTIWATVIASSLIFSYVLQISSIKGTTHRAAESLYISLDEREISPSESTPRYAKRFMDAFDLRYIELVDDSDQVFYKQTNQDLDTNYLSVMMGGFFQQKIVFDPAISVNVNNRGVSGNIVLTEAYLEYSLSGLYLQSYGLILFGLLFLALFTLARKVVKTDQQSSLADILQSLDQFSLNELESSFVDPRLQDFFKRVASDHRQLEGRLRQEIFSIGEIETSLRNKIESNKEMLSERLTYERFFRKELSGYVNLIKIGTIQVGQMNTSPAISSILEQIVRNIDHCNDALTLFKSTFSDTGDHSDNFESLPLFDHIQNSIFKLHDLAATSEVKIDYMPNVHISGELHGFDSATAFNIYYILRLLIQSSIQLEQSKEVKNIFLNTLVFEDSNGESCLKITYSLSNASKTILQRMEGEQLSLVRYLARKFGGTLNIEPLENPANDTLTIEISYETPCKINLMSRGYQSGNLKQHEEVVIGAYDQDISIANKMVSMIQLSGYQASVINGLANVSEYDLVFVSDINPEQRDYKYLMKQDVNVIAFERETDKNYLRNMQEKLSIAGCLSYCSKSKEIAPAILHSSVNISNQKNVISSSASSNLLSATPDWLTNRIRSAGDSSVRSPAGRAKAILLDMNLNRRGMIISLFQDPDEAVEIVPMDAYSEKDLLKLKEIKPDLILVDENYKIDGEPIGMTNFVDAIEFEGIVVVLAQEKIVAENISQISQHVIPSYSGSLKDRISHMGKLSQSRRHKKPTSKDKNVVFFKRNDK